MAKETSVNLRNWQFYQIFIRQFSPTHDFKGAIEKLPYVKSLGTDCIQLVPFHPIGIFRRRAPSEALIPSGIIMRLTR